MPLSHLSLPHTQTHTCKHMPTWTHKHAHTHTKSHKHTLTQTHTCDAGVLGIWLTSPFNSRVISGACRSMSLHAGKNTHRHTHTHTHTPTHKQTHTQVRDCWPTDYLINTSNTINLSTYYVWGCVCVFVCVYTCLWVCACVCDSLDLLQLVSRGYRSKWVRLFLFVLCVYL